MFGAVLLVTAVAAWLRLFELGRWSFWVDEAFTFRDATMPFSREQGFLTTARSDYPLAFLMLRFLIGQHWIGESEGWLRLPFACLGIVSVPMLWLAGRRLVGEGPALVAAGLLALMPWHVYWSQNARGYVAVVLASSVALWRTWRWIETDRVLDIAIALVVTIIGFLFHPSAALQLVGLAAFLLLRRATRVRPRTMVAWAAGSLVVAMLLPFAFSVLPTVREFAKSKGDPSLIHLVVTTGYYFRPLLLAAAAAGLVLVYRRHGRQRALLLACYVVVPFLCLAIVGASLVLTTARYAICTLPLLLWLAGVGVVEIARLVPRGGSLPRALLAGFVGIALALDFGAGTWHYFRDQNGDRGYWREASEFVRQRYGDRRLYVLTTNEPTVRYYLLRDSWATGIMSNGRLVIDTFDTWSVGGEFGGSRKHAPGGDNHLRWRLEEARADEADFVVVVAKSELEEKDPEGGLWRLLQTDFELVHYLPLWAGPKDESIYVYAPRTP